MNEPALGPLVGYLTGPTAAGKTEVALALCERHGWAILSIDSRQIYHGLDLGTAKPTAEERARVPHLLIDALEVDEACSAGRFRTLALEALAELRAAGRLALAVGGAGLYWEALVRGLHPLPPSSPEIRRRHEAILQEEGVEGLYRRLREVDPEMAARLRPRDRQRIGRALEVAELTGEPMSRILARPLDGAAEGADELAGATEVAGELAGADNAAGRAFPRALPVVALLRPRAELYARITRRCQAMLDAGLVEELRELIRRGVSPDAPGLRTVGYREFLPHLLHGAPLAECTEDFIRATRRYAKRQETWLRNRLPERREVWMREGEVERPIDAVVGEVEKALVEDR